jgi:hypothetical protein
VLEPPAGSARSDLVNTQSHVDDIILPTPVEIATRGEKRAKRTLSNSEQARKIISRVESKLNGRDCNKVISVFRSMEI